jgi:NDP-sugar pyrophosphorylase family protein
LALSNMTERSPVTLQHTTAAILAGGFGTRLRPVLSDRPKTLAPVRGRPFIAFLLEQLLTSGIPRVVLCTGFMGDVVQATLGERFGPLPLDYSQETAALGTGGALRLALPQLDSEHVLVMNGDSFCDVNLASFWALHVERQAAATLLLTEVPDTGRYGQVETDSDGAVQRFREKEPGLGPGWINAGVYLLRRSVVEAIPEGRAVSLERDVFPALIGRGLYAYSGGGRFLDIGTPESYEQAVHFFTSQESS